MGGRAVLGKCAALTCSLALVSAYVHQRAGGQPLFVFRKFAARASIGERADRRDSQSIWAPNFPSPEISDATLISGMNSRMLLQSGRTMPGPKSSGVVAIEDILMWNSESRSTINATETAPGSGLPEIPGDAPLPEIEVSQP